MGRLTNLSRRLRPADVPPAFPASSHSPDGRRAAIEAAQARAAEVAEILQLDAGEVLHVRNATVDAEGSVHTDTTIHLRYDRAYDGLPVVPGQVLVHLTRAGEIRDALTVPVHSIAVPSTTPTVSGDEAGDIAVAATDWHEAVGRIPRLTGKRVRPEEYPRRPITVGVAPTLVIHVPRNFSGTARHDESTDGKPTLTWRTGVSDGHEIYEEVFVDAQRGIVLWRAPIRRA